MFLRDLPRPSLGDSTLPDPYTPPDGTWNVTGGITATGTIQAAIFTATTAFRAANGSAAAPSISFTNGTTSGFYFDATPLVGISVAGAAVATFVTGTTSITGALTATTTVTATTAFRAPSGSVSVPGYGFTSDIDVGYYYTATQINTTIAGSKVMDVSGDGINLAPPVAVNTGNANAVLRVTAAAGTAIGGTTCPVASFTGGAHTGLLTEFTDLTFTPGNITYAINQGTISTGRVYLFNGPTIACAAGGGTTLSNPATIAISGPPVQGSNMVLTDPRALWIQSGAVQIDPGTVAQSSSPSGGLTISAPAFSSVPNIGSTLYVVGPSTLASANYAVYIGSGTLRHDGTVAIFGAGEAGTPAACTIRGAQATGTNTNANTNWIIAAPRGTGTGSTGSIQFQATTTRQAGGSTAHTQATLFQVGYNHGSGSGTALSTTGMVSMPSYTYTDRTTGNGTVAAGCFLALAQPTYASSSATTTVTDAATFYVANGPAVGANAAITSSYAIWSDAGLNRFDGIVIVGGGEGGTPAANTLRGPNAAGTDIAGAAMAINAGLGTGNGTCGTITFGAALSRPASSATIQSITNIITLGNSQSAHPGASGYILSAAASTWTDGVTASGTATQAHAFRWGGPTLAAINTSITTTTTTTVKIDKPPIDGTNMTITGAIGLQVGGTAATYTKHAAGFNYALIDCPAHTVTLTATTQVTSTVGVAAARLGQITIDKAGASLTVDTAATLYITGAPIQGTATVTTLYALWVDAGSCRFDGNMGFFSTAPQAQQVSAANLTNNVTSGGTDNTVDNVIAAAVDTTAADLTTTRNAVYQLARKLKQINDGLRTYGLFT